LVGETEVTQAAYKRVLQGNNPSHVKGDDLPVDSVTWSEAKTYCGSTGGRLPTEAEWEWAARAGTTGATYGNLDNIAWHSGNSVQKTHPGGKKEANAWGLHDMLGNVLEWTSDDYDGKKVLRGGSWSHVPQFVRGSARFKAGPENRLAVIGFRCAGD
jgi:formylglycine-generating enzyme required for sulfatase activity